MMMRTMMVMMMVMMMIVLLEPAGVPSCGAVDGEVPRERKR